MTISRRTFVAAGSLLVAGLPFARAQDLDLRDKYEEIRPPQPTATPGKVEVVEVFSYTCPHCYSFLPTMEKLEREKPDYVVLRRMPAIFRNSWEIYAKAYYVAELLGKVEAVHRPIFEAFHDKGNKLDTPEALRSFFADHGVEPDMFDKTFDSFAMDGRVRQSKVMQGKYGIRGTPSVVVHGRYRVTGSTAGSHANMLNVILGLAEREKAQLSA